MSRCLAQSDHMHPFFVLGIRKSVNDQEYFEPTPDRSNRVPTFFTIDDAVEDSDRQGIGKNELRNGKTDPMLAKVRPLFLGAPGNPQRR
jgi:hypothetical protein